MKLNNTIRKTYYDVCRKAKFHSGMDEESHEALYNGFMAQKMLIEKLYADQKEELDEIRLKAIDQAKKDYDYFYYFN